MQTATYMSVTAVESGWRGEVPDSASLFGPKPAQPIHPVWATYPPHGGRFAVRVGGVRFIGSWLCQRTFAYAFMLTIYFPQPFRPTSSSPGLHSSSPAAATHWILSSRCTPTRHRMFAGGPHWDALRGRWPQFPQSVLPPPLIFPSSNPASNQAWIGNTPCCGKNDRSRG